jgi:apolipoprotein D and lipocalin family protein
MLMNKLIKIQLALSLMILAACTGGPPGGLTVVKNFELERYQGIWFEIARLDHRFERGLSQVSAEYRIQADNTVQVINRGFDVDSGQWEQAVGKARFIDTADQGALKVSFFGPFYGAYNIVALDQENYQWEKQHSAKDGQKQEDQESW